MKTNYTAHAALWDWDLYVDTAAQAFWRAMSGRYGRRVLSPMCALGQTAATLAEAGCTVTALDYTPEMIAEGRKRYGHIHGLTYVQGDIRDFTLPELVDFCFIDGTDLFLLPSLADVRQALGAIHRHLRPGGGFGLSVAYPPEASHAYPMQRFDPRVPRRDGTVTWKEGDSTYDAATGRQEIHQILYAQRDGETQRIDHRVTLQYYAREALWDAFAACGFQLAGAYCDHAFHTAEAMRENGYLEWVKA